MKTKQEYITELTEVIEKTKYMIEAIDKLLPVMKTLSGKAINQRKRINDALQAALPGFTVSFNTKYSWYEIAVYKTINHCHTTILQINCGYIGEVEYFDFDLITGIKERTTKGTLGNNYYFGTDKKYSDCRYELIKYEKQLLNVDADYKAYLDLHDKLKNFNVPFLSIDARR